LRLATQRRHDRSVDERTRDHEIGIERTLRLPGKAAKDMELGDLSIEQANYVLGDALHESARLLLKSWFGWQREDLAVREWATQSALLEKQHATVLKRVTLGDAARLEALLSEAHWAQVRAQYAQAEARRDQAMTEFTQHFPGIALSVQGSARLPEAVPTAPAEGASWRERLLEHSHELAMARIAARQGRLTVQRLEADRLPDPTLGLAVGRERNGLERVVGLQLTIPLPGSARSAAIRGGVAEADAAHAQMVLQRARSTLTQWQRLADVALRMEDNAHLLDKAWRLGEGQFADLQTARRQSIEARLAATQAQLDANEARYRLLLDAHLLWDLDTESHGHGDAD
jgi:outer membrane protein TolC